MQPFSSVVALRGVASPYPHSDEMVRAVKDGGNAACLALARLWLSEGIPYVFRDTPSIYDSLRVWIGRRLEIDPKEVTLIGSARTGYSMSPDSYARPFSGRSDLDLTIVSSCLFERLKANYLAWVDDYRRGDVRPRNSKERTYWDENAYGGERRLGRGFLDAKLVPLLTRYRTAQTIGQTMFLVQRKLEITEGAPRVRQANVRVYKAWSSFVSQLARNVRTLEAVG